MYGLSRRLRLIAALLAAFAARADLVEETLDQAPFGKFVVYRATDEPKGVALLLSWRCCCPVWGAGMPSWQRRRRK